jgi:hypothetical protein
MKALGLVGELISCTSDLLSAVGMAEETEAPLVDAETEEEEEGGGYRKTTPTSVNIIVRVSTVPENAKTAFKSGGSFKIYEDQVKSDANAMQVLDDTGKVLMNIVGGAYFSIEHTEKLVALSKKSRQRGS